MPLQPYHILGDLLDPPRLRETMAQKKSMSGYKNTSAKVQAEEHVLHMQPAAQHSCGIQLDCGSLEDPELFFRSVGSKRTESGRRTPTKSTSKRDLLDRFRVTFDADRAFGLIRETKGKTAETPSGTAPIILETFWTGQNRTTISPKLTRKNMFSTVATSRQSLTELTERWGLSHSSLGVAPGPAKSRNPAEMGKTVKMTSTSATPSSR